MRRHYVNFGKFKVFVTLSVTGPCTKDDFYFDVDSFEEYDDNEYEVKGYFYVDGYREIWESTQYEPCEVDDVPVIGIEDLILKLMGDFENVTIDNYEIEEFEAA